MPRVVDHDAQRGVLLDRAFDLFADQGYAATSMRQLAAGLEVSTGTLYHYFGNKESIFEHMIQRLSARDVLAATGDISGETPLPDRMAQVFGWVRANEAYLRRVLLLIFDFQRHRDDPKGRAMVRQAAATYRDAFYEQVGHSVVAWSLVLGMLVQGILDPDTSAPQEHLLALSLLTKTP
jgi:AcrR family transcriptional regulator